MAEHHPEIIVVKRKVSHGGGHHGGAWKIAFADFMTAMMAFFLVLWIINASDKDTKTIIARYFNPIKLENPSRAKKGLHGATSPPTESNDAKADKTGTSDEPSKDAKAQPKPPDDKSKQKPEKDRQDKKDGKAKASSKPFNPDVADTDPGVADAELFRAPFDSLERIVSGKGLTAPGAAPEIGSSDSQREAGALSVDAFRDPFKPIGPGSPEDPVSLEAEISPGVEAQDGPSLERKKAVADGTAPKKPGRDPETKESAARGEGAVKTEGVGEPDSAAKLMKDVLQKLGAAARSALGPSIEVRATEEGLLISLTDKLNFSMFAIGSAEPRPELIGAMESVAQALKARPGAIVLRGHTDARAYRSGGYDNWRLSSARAQMAYYMLVRGGLPETRVARVEGYADRALRDPAHPLAAENRRLEILLREPKP